MLGQARLPGAPCSLQTGSTSEILRQICSRPSLRTWRGRVGRQAGLLQAVFAPTPPVRPAEPAAKPAPIRLVPTQRSGQPSSSAHGSPRVGKPLPLGATLDPDTGATNFALFSGSAWGVSLCLFTEHDLREGRATHEVLLDPRLNRTGDTWHVMLPDLDSTLLYGFRVFGPHQENPEDVAAEGHRFSQDRVVLDPYAKVILNGRRVWGEMGKDLPYGTPGVLGHAATWPQAAAALPQRRGTGAEFDWEGDRPLNLPMEDLVIYEMHVRGFTRSPSSRVRSPGTYAGLVEKLDYLQRLGVNAIELMPIHEFNELEYYQVIPGSGAYRFNMWGYSTVGFFAPMARYSAAVANGGSGQDVLNEFKQMVKECHRRGIEVILDVVFNHTAEGNEMGPTLSFRGLDNRVYYMLAPAGQYYNYSGCGNTMNCNHPVTRQFILDSLKYWVTEMHVDGFRFDLGSILTRAHSQWHKTQPMPPGQAPAAAPAPAATSAAEAPGAAAATAQGSVPAAPLSGGAIVDENGIMTDGAGVPTGTPLTDPPLVEMISEDPVLRHTKLIAEAWDCDGLNQVGAFPHYGRWSEWNGHFRDTVRQFVKGTDGPWASNFASVLCGSPHIYLHEPGAEDWWGNHGGRRWKGGRGPTAAVNFVTAHDGFTLADLVSYNEKHNEANGEDNRDGESHNLSWNCGEEGATSTPPVVALRQRQMRNFMAALLLGHGVPMFYMGDEYGHSKGGNNNTYCHDSELNWLDWDQANADEKGLLRFVRHMIQLRKAVPELRRRTYVQGSEVEWHGLTPATPDWTDTSRFLAFTLRSGGEGGGLYVAFNTSHLPQMVQLPVWHGRAWQPYVDSGKLAPFDVLRSDDRLSEQQLAAALGAGSMWTLQHAYPMLPWSMIVLESVPYDQAAQAIVRGAAVEQSSSSLGAFAEQGAGRLGGWGFFDSQHVPAAAREAPGGSAAAPAFPSPPPTSPGTPRQQQSPAAAAANAEDDPLSAAKLLAAKIKGGGAAGDGVASVGASSAPSGRGQTQQPSTPPPTTTLPSGAAEPHPTSFLPTDACGTAARAWHGAPQDVFADLSEEERRVYEEAVRENERLRSQLGQLGLDAA